MNTATNTITTREGDTISGIAYEVYGSSRGRVEPILSANPGLCEYPALLPAGVVIRLPVFDSQVKPVKTLNLWD